MRGGGSGTVVFFQSHPLYPWFSRGNKRASSLPQPEFELLLGVTNICKRDTSYSCRLFNVHMMFGEARKDLKKQEKKKLKKEKHKSKENLTRKLKVCRSIQSLLCSLTNQMTETEHSPSFVLCFLFRYFSVHPSLPVFLLQSNCLFPSLGPPSFFLSVCLCLCLGLCVCPSVCATSFYNDNASSSIASSTLTPRCIIFSSTQQSFAVLSEQVHGRKIPVGTSMNLMKTKFTMRKLMNGQRHARHVVINWHTKKCNTK